MIKLFVAVDLQDENGEPASHTFCFNYGPNEFDHFKRAVGDYVYNHSTACYVELNVDGKPLYKEDILRSFSSNDPNKLAQLFSQYCDNVDNILLFPLEKTA